MPERKRAEHVIVDAVWGKKRLIDGLRTRELISGKHIIANTYLGPTTPRTHNRGVKDIDRDLTKIDITVDSRLSFSLNQALVEGRRRIKVLDIGSGDFGLATSLLADPSTAPKTRDFLAQHPKFGIDLVGLTDSPSVVDHLKEKPFTFDEQKLTDQDKDVHQGICAKNFYYTLARWQTLAVFLEAVKEPDVGKNELDIIIAHNSLRYMPLVIFKEVVQTGVDYLRPGGIFIANYFAGNLPGFFGGHNYGFHTSAEYGSPTFDFVAVLNGYVPDPERIFGFEISHQILEKDGVIRKDAFGFELGRFEQQIKRGWELYKKLDAVEAEIEQDNDVNNKKLVKAFAACDPTFIRESLTDEEIEQAKLQVDKNLPPDEQLDMLAELTLGPAFRRYEKKRRFEDLAQKMEFMKTFPGFRFTHANMTYVANNWGFVIYK